VSQPRQPRQQCAALPLAVAEDGQRRVMLITSRETRRWVLPKGWAEDGMALHLQAAREAYEEAGLQGRIGSTALGRYRYRKLRRGKKATKAVPCEVEVFPLLVERQLADWPEKGQRETRWFTLAEAALLVEEGGLVALLLRLAVLPEQALDGG
jgi:8-oxo-dGTP pyrophosphatase MutT (NUDIX family)